MEKQYWCFYFAGDPELLNYGLENNLWLCRYVYKETYLYNDAPVTKNWKNFKNLKAGDECLAYLSGSVFYAAGDITDPQNQPDFRSNIDDLVLEKKTSGKWDCSL